MSVGKVSIPGGTSGPLLNPYLTQAGVYEPGTGIGIGLNTLGMRDSSITPDL